MTVLLDSFSNIEEQRFVLPNIKWQQYESLLATLGDYHGLRLIYLEGTLEIFMPSPEHELLKKAIARLLERYAEEVEIPLHGYGSTTFRREALGRGLEPDECYCIGQFKEFPDFAVEINLTSGGVDKLSVYKGLGIPEVLIWQGDRLTLYDLRGNAYGESLKSQFFPDLDWQLFAEYIRPRSQPQAIQEFLQVVRSR
ncbi:Uma2 family endonuclease [Spirulina sp. 06S082]|uniref:Uma2 family endonuclease n=1 Tax=Spirulina sp. 06S082 TaxID=3110248 RepID=UPI002B1EE6FF|nr:Uma2 family endonuclease [Spirulina sp. 06S082]MEA5467824.1 Uma2 family endonuclease [Spirulina sp. 06S082]